MNRRMLIFIFLGFASGCSVTDSESDSRTTKTNQVKPTYTPPTESNNTEEPKVTSSVWLPPLEKYDKPAKKQKWFQPNVGNGGGVAKTCGSCGGSGQFTCGVCNGNGKLSTPTGFRNDEGTWIQRFIPCLQCSGSGGKPCSSCGGRGYRKEDG